MPRPARAPNIGGSASIRAGAGRPRRGRLAVLALTAVAALALFAPPGRPRSPGGARPQADAGACAPGGTLADFEGDVAEAVVDVVAARSALAGEQLAVTLVLRVVPSALTVNRPGVPDAALEYEWAVLVDTDGYLATGASDARGAEYELAADALQVRRRAERDRAVRGPGDRRPGGRVAPGGRRWRERGGPGGRRWTAPRARSR